MKKKGILLAIFVMCLAMTGCGKINKEDFGREMSSVGIDTPDSVCSSIATFDYNFFSKVKAGKYDKDAFKENYGLEMGKNIYMAGYFVMSDDKSDADKVFSEYGAYLEKNGYEMKQSDGDSTTYFNGTTVVFISEIGPFAGDYEEKYQGKYGVNVTLENSTK